MQGLHFLQVLTERVLQGARQHGDAVLTALSIPHNDLVVTEVDVLNAKSKALCQAKAGAI